MNRRFSSQFLGMNSTVVYRNGDAFVIDPGVFPRETERIKRFLEKHDLSNISVLLTHTHGDHISGWHAFRKFPTYGHISIDKKSENVRNNDVRYLQGMYRKQSIEEVSHLAFPEDIQYVPEAEFVEVKPFRFAFFHTPGHSVDMSVIIIPEEQLMFSGDMLIQTPAPFVLHSTRLYWHSLKKIKVLVSEYDLNCLIPGHGKPAKSQEEVIDRIEHEQKYLQDLVWEGIKLARAGMEPRQIKESLNKRFKSCAGLHAHQVNIQTFLREMDKWLETDLNDLNYF